MTEAQFQAEVMKLASLYGWLVAHFTTSLTVRGRYITAVAGDGKGFPDLVLGRPPRVIFAELKAVKGTVSVHQERWLELLRQCPGVETYLWRPADLEEIAVKLKGE
jgi:hypothetical protein